MKKHHLKKIDLHREHIKILLLLIAVGITLLFIKNNFLAEQGNLFRNPNWGISYSPHYAQALGLDPQQTYLQILKDLQPQNIRLSAYWNEIEPKPDKFDFSQLDYYINQAQANQSQIMLAVGFKLPRWPECRTPSWLDQNNKQLRQERQLLMLEKVIKYYDLNPAVTSFQIENEPLLVFGVCPPPDEQFLKEEVKLAKKLTKKPLLLTDSGELSSWILPMQISDYFGTTLYRTVEAPVFGLVPYPLRPWFYRIKSEIIRKVFAPLNQETMVVELQAEPWSPMFITQLPTEEQLARFPQFQMEDNINFAKSTGFNKIYLWGVEWWYYIRLEGQPQYWEYAKEIFKTRL